MVNYVGMIEEKKALAEITKLKSEDKLTCLWAEFEAYRPELVKRLDEKVTFYNVSKFRFPLFERKLFNIMSKNSIFSKMDSLLIEENTFDC